MKSEIDMRMEDAGLVDIHSLDPSIKIDIKYATPNNFTGRVLYRQPFGVYAEPALARGIARANANLHRLLPGSSLVIYDAARPLSIQKEMFDMVRGTDMQAYIADPYSPEGAGFHNYGMAVDLSVLDESGKPLDMGSGFDSFSEISHVGREREMALEGRISADAYANRMLLYALLGHEGLMPHPLEWWHFQYYQLDEDKKRFRLLDF